MQIIIHNGKAMVDLEEVKHWIMDEFFCMCGRPDQQHTPMCNIRIGLRLLEQIHQWEEQKGQVTR